MSDTESRKMLCGKCHVEVKSRIDDDGNGTVSCPLCGQQDTLDAATAEAVEDLTVKMLDRAFSGLKQGGPLTVKKTIERQYRFVFDS